MKNKEEKRDIDFALIERAKSGEQTAFNLLFAKYRGRLVRILSRFLHNHAEIEDVAQETLLKAYKALPDFNHDSAFFSWLYRIAINTANSHFRAKSKQDTLSLSELSNTDDDDNDDFIDSRLTDTANPENIVVSQELAQTIEKAMQELPEKLRQAIVLREIDGLSYEEIAKIANCPVGTVRSRIYNAREAIAQKIRPLIDNDDETKRW
ncbi:MAG: sigma-70 family RNA polymerase sigma factor [Neisseriaceae bacterium]|nr:sigma-70 family RNA polymerase sigma factor [Neisseriaceae bacterium]